MPLHAARKIPRLTKLFETMQDRMETQWRHIEFGRRAVTGGHGSGSMGGQGRPQLATASHVWPRRVAACKGIFLNYGFLKNVMASGWSKRFKIVCAICVEVGTKVLSNIF